MKNMFSRPKYDFPINYTKKTLLEKRVTPSLRVFLVLTVSKCLNKVGLIEVQSL